MTSSRSSLKSKVCSSAASKGVSKSNRTYKKYSSVECMTSMHTPCKWNDFCSIIASSIELECMKGWKLGKFIGSGATGITYAASNHSTGAKGVVKILVTFNRHEHAADGVEAQLQQDASSIIPSPKVFHVCSGVIRGGEAFVTLIFMEKIDSILYDYIETHSIQLPRLIVMLKGLKNAQFVHNDLHGSNIAVRRRKYIVLDFGRSAFIGGLPRRKRNECYTADLVHVLYMLSGIFGSDMRNWRQEFAWFMDAWRSHLGIKETIPSSFKDSVISPDPDRLRSLRAQFTQMVSCYTKKEYAGFGNPRECRLSFG